MKKMYNKTCATHQRANLERDLRVTIQKEQSYNSLNNYLAFLRVWGEDDLFFKRKEKAIINIDFLNFQSIPSKLTIVFLFLMAESHFISCDWYISWMHPLMQDCIYKECGLLLDSLQNILVKLSMYVVWTGGLHIS